jgi:hypothetical protein
MDENPHPHPHTPRLKKFMENIRTQLGKRGVEMLDDRGIPDKSITLTEYKSLGAFLLFNI